MNFPGPYTSRSKSDQIRFYKTLESIPVLHGPDQILKNNRIDPSLSLGTGNGNTYNRNWENAEPEMVDPCRDRENIDTDIGWARKMVLCNGLCG